VFLLGQEDVPSPSCRTLAAHPLLCLCTNGLYWSACSMYWSAYGTITDAVMLLLCAQQDEYREIVARRVFTVTGKQAVCGQACSIGVTAEYSMLSRGCCSVCGTSCSVGVTAELQTRTALAQQHPWTPQSLQQEGMPAPTNLHLLYVPSALV
jgi:hypothetical protein